LGLGCVETRLTVLMDRLLVEIGRASPFWVFPVQ